MNIKDIIICRLGLDKSIVYSSGSRIVQALGGLFSVFFISKYLSDTEQGFYFTFASIIALQVFFELGLTNIITQYVAHEMSKLKWEDNGFRIIEDHFYKSRLASLLRFCFKWYSFLSFLLFFVLNFVGYIFFSTFEDKSLDISWEIPWALVVIGTIAKLFQSPFMSFLKGLGKVEQMSEISFWQQLIILISTCVGLMLGWGLYVMGVGYVLSVVVWFLYVFKSDLFQIFLDLKRTKITARVNYKKEIFPFQWKISLSWISGYFIFQLFNPVLFATEGAVVAGQMGLTLSVLNAIQAFSMSWINTKVPLYSSLIAQGKYEKLNLIFNKTLRQQTFVSFILLASMFLVIIVLDFTQLSIGEGPIVNRFLTGIPLILLMFTIILNNYISSWATYCRCFKKEPFLMNSIVIGLSCMSSTFTLGNYFGLWGIVIGYTFIRILSLFWSRNIYINFKNKETI